MTSNSNKLQTIRVETEEELEALESGKPLETTDFFDTDKKIGGAVYPPGFDPRDLD